MNADKVRIQLQEYKFTLFQIVFYLQVFFLKTKSIEFRFETAMSFSQQKLSVLLASDSVVDIRTLRSLAWSGCPKELRLRCWCFSLNFFPTNSRSIPEFLETKCHEYQNILKTLPDIIATKQIELDIPRTFTESDFFKLAEGVSVISNVLKCWAFRNPASSYVQGINDLLVPIIQVIQDSNVTSSPESPSLDDVSMYAYFILTKVLNSMQDNYIYGQPGIQSIVHKSKDLLRRSDKELWDHLEKEQLDLLTVTFRWINCLFVREFPLDCVLLIWDACISDDDGFSGFLPYIVTGLIKHHRNKILESDFQNLMFLFQKLPTAGWKPADVATLLAESFVLKSLYHNSPSHLA
jgi:TBC1 domain family member 2